MSEVFQTNSVMSQPVAYQKGLADFYGRDFCVNPNVLIPRPETEAIVDMVLNLLGKPYLPGVKPSKARLAQNAKVLEIGTGSGCIAITLKLEAPELDIVATDISDKALGVARANTKKFGVNIKLRKADLMDGVTEQFDLMIANLPYVDKDWDWLDKKALSYEPSLALYAEDHGLKLIFRLIEQAGERRTPSLILEADPCQHDDIVNFAAKQGYSLIEKRGFALLLA